MKILSGILLSAGCAAILAAGVRAQGPGPDGAPPPEAQPGTPQPGPDGAPNARPDGPGAPGAPGAPGGGPARGAWGGGPGDHRGSFGPWGRSGPSPELTAKLQKAAELDGKLWPVIQKLRAASGKEREAGKPELRKLIGELFDAKVAVAEEEQKSHEKRAAELKTRISKRKARRDAIIDQKLNQMLGEDDGDDWD